jgi:hypothetical protein
MKAWQRARRELVDLLVASADPLTLERVLAHMEKTICAWERWPRSHNWRHNNSRYAPPSRR